MNPDVSLADVAARAGIPPELISALVIGLAPRLVSPLGSVWKRWFQTSGPDTRTVLKWLSALIVGVGGFAAGLYGYDVRGLVNAIFAGVLTYLKTTGDYDRAVAVAVKADRLSAPVSDSETPTTERPASLADVEAEISRQTGFWPAVPDLDDDAPLIRS